MKRSTSNKTILILTIYALLLAAGCRSVKEPAYFQSLPRDTVLTTTILKTADVRIQPADVLYINITSNDPLESARFNVLQISVMGGADAAASSTTGYLVDNNGNIKFHKLGPVKAGGLTRGAFEEVLRKALEPDYLKGVTVNVRFLNHGVTVLGEVMAPHQVPMGNKEQLTVLEVLGMSGDIKESGRRDNVLVIRQTPAGREFKRLNLTDNSVFSSPYFYLQNEDVVYVEAKAKTNPAKTQQIVGYVLSGASVLLLLYDRVNK